MSATIEELKRLLINERFEKSYLISHLVAPMCMAIQITHAIVTDTVLTVQLVKMISSKHYTNKQKRR